MKAIDKNQFEELFKRRLGTLYQRAEVIFDNYGPRFSPDVTNVLLHAVDQGEEKVEEVLSILKKHYNEHLNLQHPDIRGTVCNSLGINETEVMFIDICVKTLGLQPAS